MELKVIATIKSDFKNKFGIPRQSGLADRLTSFIVFEKEYSIDDAFRGLSDYSHIYVIWEFSEQKALEFSPTVRPPRLGGNKRMGVFATRSPNRPNRIALSCVRLQRIFKENGRMVLEISGGDMLDGTPVFDIKPYLPFVDSIPDAIGGFAETVKDQKLTVIIPDDIKGRIMPKKLEGLLQILSQDPRPHYIDDPERIYGFVFANMEIKFRVNDDILTVIDVI